MNIGKSILLDKTGVFDEEVLYHMKYMTVDCNALFYYVLRKRLLTVLILAVLSTTYLGMAVCVGAALWYERDPAGGSQFVPPLSDLFSGNFYPSGMGGKRICMYLSQDRGRYGKKYFDEKNRATCGGPWDDRGRLRPGRICQSGSVYEPFKDFLVC